MRVIGSQAAGAFLVLQLDEVRPAQGIVPQQIVEALAQRYNFATRPRVGAQPFRLQVPTIGGGATAIPGAMQMLVQSPLSLQNGTATIGDQTILVTRIDVMPDVSRIIVQTLTTDEGDIILDDIISVLEGVCGFKNVRQFSEREYASNCIVQFEKAIEESVAILGEIQKILNPAMTAATGVKQDMQFERIMFGFDPTLLPASKAQTNSFVLERRVERPFSENRYFSSAPLRTNDHILVLEKIGILIEGGN